MSADFRGPATAAPTAGGHLTPGENLRAEIERLGLDQIAVAEATGVSRQSINNIVNNRQPISRAMAARLGVLTGHDKDYWLQSSFAASNAARAGARRVAAAESRPFGVRVNHEIVDDIRSGVMSVDPFDEDNVHLASIDLTLDDFILTTEGKKIDISDGQSFRLEAGRTINVSTREWIKLPGHYIARVGAMNSLARIGIMTSHGFQIDPGFEGHLQFCVFNAGGRDFELRSGMPVISIEIMPLGATPTDNARAAEHVRTAGDRSPVISIFRNDVCDKKIRDSIRSCVKLDVQGDKVKARILELDIEIYAGSADDAAANAVNCALGALLALRDNPKSAAAERAKYQRFFGEIADNIYFDAEETRRALACFGFPSEAGGALIVTLRGGEEAVVHLPSRNSSISLRHLARRLSEDPLALILILAGLVAYRA